MSVSAAAGKTGRPMSWMRLLMVRKTGGGPAWIDGHEPRMAPAVHAGLGEPRQSGLDCKTVRKSLHCGLEAWPMARANPSDRPRSLRRLPARACERLHGPGWLSRLFREVKERGYAGFYTVVTDFLREIRPGPASPFEVRFEAAPGVRAQVDFAQFQIVFTDELTVPRIVWLFSLVLSYSRLIGARFMSHQDLATVLRCHVSSFEALADVLHEVLKDCMKSVVTGEANAGGIL